MRKSLVAAALAAVVVGPASGTPMLSGPAEVVDGDTLRIAGEAIRLHGIDAPELAQPCTDAVGIPFACGRTAARALERLVQGRTVVCRTVDRDGFGRAVAVCEADGIDLNRAMVASGWALAFRRYADDYVATERAATRARLGLWAGNFDAPWEHRAAARAVTTTAGAPVPGCAIKGNISKNGRIYHVPGSEHYDRVGISLSRGERWFCTVGEAEAAGWRAPRG